MEGMVRKKNLFEGLMDWDLMGETEPEGKAHSTFTHLSRGAFKDTRYISMNKILYLSWIFICKWQSKICKGIRRQCGKFFKTWVYRSCRITEEGIIKPAVTALKFHFFNMTLSPFFLFDSNWSHLAPWLTYILLLCTSTSLIIKPSGLWGYDQHQIILGTKPWVCGSQRQFQSN